jgi:hypothetical protein
MRNRKRGHENALTKLSIFKCGITGSAIEIHYEDEGYELCDGVEDDEAGYGAPYSAPPCCRRDTD